MRENGQRYRQTIWGLLQRLRAGTGLELILVYDYLSGDFIRGYTKAIQDIQAIFEYVQLDMRWHNKNLNYKYAVKLLKCILDSRMYLREQDNKVYDKMAGFIRYNQSKDDFEYYDPKKRGDNT